MDTSYSPRFAEASLADTASVSAKYNQLDCWFEVAMLLATPAELDTATTTLSELTDWDHGYLGQPLPGEL